MNKGYNVWLVLFMNNPIIKAVLIGMLPKELQDLCFQMDVSKLSRTPWKYHRNKDIETYGNKETSQKRGNKEIWMN